jgi:hypothetical protein
MASNSTRTPAGARRASRANTPTAKAGSVAIGIPQPRAAGPPHVNTKNTAAGTTAPPTAASAGTTAARGCANAPTASSRLTSSPMAKKNTVITASLTQCRASCGNPTGCGREVSHSAVYESLSGLFAHVKATAVATSSTTPGARSPASHRRTPTGIRHGPPATLPLSSSLPPPISRCCTLARPVSPLNAPVAVPNCASLACNNAKFNVMLLPSHDRTMNEEVNPNGRSGIAMLLR